MATRGSRNSSKATKAGPRAKPSRAVGRRAKELHLRRAPLQSRGHATFEHILDATGQLLDELGVEGVNTNLIARAARINIATLYQYFPNKQAILLALFHRQAQRRSQMALSLLEGIAHATDWPVRIDAFVDGMARVRGELPGTIALMQAMRVDPELREFNLRASDEVAGTLAEELVAAGRLSRDDARVVARCTLEANAVLIDVAHMSYGGRNSKMLREAKHLLRRYLAPYLPEPAAATGRGRK